MRHVGSGNPNAQTDADKDCFRPPTIPTICQCLHCGEEYETYLIQWNTDRLIAGRFGHWVCPTEGCDGVGFGFDILPIDPDYVDEYGNRVWIDDASEDCDDIEALDDMLADDSMIEGSDQAADIEAWLSEDDDDESIPF